MLFKKNMDSEYLGKGLLSPSDDKFERDAQGCQLSQLTKVQEIFKVAILKKIKYDHSSSKGLNLEKHHSV